MDATAKESNYLDSVKRYFADLMDKVNIPVTWDASLKAPNLQGNEVDRWLSIQLGSFFPSSSYVDTILILNCLTRQDNEMYKLSRLVDYVRSSLTNPHISDGLGRIPLYDTYQDKWVQVGTILVRSVDMAPVFSLNDRTKVRILTVTTRHMARC
jgi:hypothetical protein